MDDPEDDYDAKHRAYADAVEREYQTLLQVHGLGQGVAYKVERFCVRALRIASGVVLLVVGLVIFGGTPSVSDTPFARLTLGDLFGALAGIGFGCLFLYWACIAAFGAGPTKDELEAKLRAQAGRNMADRRVTVRF